MNKQNVSKFEDQYHISLITSKETLDAEIDPEAYVKDMFDKYKSNQRTGDFTESKIDITSKFIKFLFFE